MITLPTSPSPATRSNPRVLIIYGAPKVGKTQVLSQLTDTLIIDTEHGTDFLSALKINANSIDEYCQIIDTIRNTTPRPYKRIAVDVVDMIEYWSEAVGTAMYKKSVPGKNFTGQSVLELPNGGGYLWLRKAFNRFFDMTMECCDEIIFVAHIRDKALVAGDKIMQSDGTFKEVSNTEVSAKDLDLTGKCRSIACSKADAIGHMFRDRENRLYISFQGNETVNCGSRCEHLRGKVFPFDWKSIYL